MSVRMRWRLLPVVGLCGLLVVSHGAAGRACSADRLVLTEGLQHCRNADPREWSEFPAQAAARSLRIAFDAAATADEWCLSLKQQNVRERWIVRINDTLIGELHRDENPILGYWTVPPDTLRDGANVLTITSPSDRPDDIRIGDVTIHRRSRTDVLHEARVIVRVVEADNRSPLPARITLTQDGHLMTVGAESGDSMAVRPGVIYCNGRAEFGVPAGQYDLVVGRGPEYGIDVEPLSLQAGSTARQTARLARRVDTRGWVAGDTHVHTLTHSGHGDAGIRERMLTIAGECVELPIATDHNTHVDYRSIAREMDLDRFFTPVIGNEVTTRIGHFNIFPVRSAETPVPDFEPADWAELSRSLQTTPDVRAVILNHGRDIHAGFRPFDPQHHLSLTGRTLDGSVLPANAMEIINSAAQQSDMMMLVRDWMRLMNAGTVLTPVGSSDSHDVARHFVGQGRTWIRCPDDNPAAIPVDTAVENFLAGRVTVGCGLFADITVDSRFGPGDLVPARPLHSVTIDAAGSYWVKADTIELYQNGRLIHSEQIPQPRRHRAGVKYRCTLAHLPQPAHDTFLVAVVRGPGVTSLYWPIARPWQPTSPDWTPLCLAVTGAVRVDADGDGHWSSAADIARDICSRHAFDPVAVLRSLESCDYAVCVHAAEQLLEHDPAAFHERILPMTQQADPTCREAFADFRAAWRESQQARAEQR